MNPLSTVTPIKPFLQQLPVPLSPCLGPFRSELSGNPTRVPWPNGRGPIVSFVQQLAAQRFGATVLAATRSAKTMSFKPSTYLPGYVAQLANCRRAQGDWRAGRQAAV